MTNLEIEAFLTVQRTGSVTKAAEMLFVSQSSLSTRLRTLERELGISLFVRGHGVRSVQLTPEGERFLPLAQQYHDLEDKMRTLSSGAPMEQVLRFATFESICSYLLPPVFRRFTQCWPETRVQIKNMATTAAVNAMVRDELDIAFSTQSRSTEHVTAIPLLSEPMSFLCAADSDYPDPVPLEALSASNEVYSFWCTDMRQWHRTVFGADAQTRVRLEIISQTRLFTAQHNAWSIVPYSIADTLRDAEDLRCCNMDFTVPDRRVYALCNRKAQDSESVNRFLDCFRAVMEEQKMPGLLL